MISRFSVFPLDFAQGSKLAALVDKLLNYTVLEELDASKCMKKPFAVDPVLQDAVKSLFAWMEEVRNAVDIQKEAGLPAIGDPVLVRDAVKNLIENGLKFSDPSSGRVKLWSQLGKDDTVEIHIEDNGPGVPPEDIDKVFKKFYQVESSFTGQVEGWGLGLPFVQKVIENLGGSVRMKSRLGKGTTVIISLLRKK